MQIDDVNEASVRQDWFEEEASETDDFPIKEYDITASPNDFNISTMFSFIESGAVKIPGFQRNYVWDIKRASKLIESIIIGLPVPQIFLYEEARNKYLVIDGQQRLMSIYYFIKQRFPKNDKRFELRRIFDQNGRIPDSVLDDDTYFVKFNLRLTERLPNRSNGLNKLNYGTLGELTTIFGLRTVRNIIIKQNVPDADDDGASSIYEIFNRLNTGGINLKPQEIRTNLYHSPFYEMLYRANLDQRWRNILGFTEPDLHMKDIEIMLRALAMAIYGKQYKPSMTRFLNLTSKRATKFPPDRVEYIENVFYAFLDACKGLPEKAFFGSQSMRVNISFIDAVFFAHCTEAIRGNEINVPAVDPEKLQLLKEDTEFLMASQFDTASAVNVTKRLERSRDILLG